MRWPRRGILIRLVIYLPLIGFLGYRAWLTRTASVPAIGDPSSPQVQTFIGPDGKAIEVIQLSPEQLEQQFGALPSTADATLDADPTPPGAEPPK